MFSCFKIALIYWYRQKGEVCSKKKAKTIKQIFHKK